MWACEDGRVWSTLRFLAVRRVLSVLSLGPSPDAKDVEIAVLRHQLAILERQVTRARYTNADRLVQEAVYKFTLEGAPKVTHFIAADT